MKPSNEEKKRRLNEFNALYKDIIDKKNEINKKISQLRHDAQTVDELAEKAFWYANDNLFFESEHGLKCMNKKTADMIDKVDELRDFSYSV